jgi:hypothetical protein
MTKIINLYGGPGSGKSTNASLLFYLFKQQHLQAEIVSEYIKSWAWEGRSFSQMDQFYILGHQARRETLLLGKVDYIITDSPVAQIAFYTKKYASKTVLKGIEAAILAFYDACNEQGHEHIHIFLERSFPYQGEGRYQSEKEANDIDKDLKEYLTEKKYNLQPVKGNEDSIKILFKNLIKEV